MYSKLPNLVFGFHGCDQSVFDRVVKQGEKINESHNSYDWLGHGSYFWENGYHRALNWAKSSPKISQPAVIGAVIDLGYCLNLTDYDSSEVLRRGYEILKIRCDEAKTLLPSNRESKKTEDVLLRDLDCAVLEQIHDFNRETEKQGYDSVRGIFIEGERVYQGSEFRERTHVQLCIINPNCIKGVFAPRNQDKKHIIP